MTPEARADAVAGLLLEGFRRRVAEFCPRCRRLVGTARRMADIPCGTGTCPNLPDARRATMARVRQEREAQRQWEERQARLKERHRLRTRALANQLTGRAPRALPQPERRRRRAASETAQTHSVPRALCWGQLGTSNDIDVPELSRRGRLPHRHPVPPHRHRRAALRLPHLHLPRQVLHEGQPLVGRGVGHQRPQSRQVEVAEVRGQGRRLRGPLLLRLVPPPQLVRLGLRGAQARLQLGQLALVVALRQPALGVALVRPEAVNLRLNLVHAPGDQPLALVEGLRADLLSQRPEPRAQEPRRAERRLGPLPDEREQRLLPDLAGVPVARRFA